MRKREVEKRCKSRFEAIKENAYERVVSTQFNVNDEDEKRNKFLERVQSISDIAKMSSSKTRTKSLRRGEKF